MSAKTLTTPLVNTNEKADAKALEYELTATGWDVATRFDTRDPWEHVQKQQSLATDLAARGVFDAVLDLAAYLPLAVVSQLVGLPEDESGRDWAAATFDALGTMNERGQAALGSVMEMVAFDTLHR